MDHGRLALVHVDHGAHQVQRPLHRPPPPSPARKHVLETTSGHQLRHDHAGAALDAGAEEAYHVGMPQLRQHHQLRLHVSELGRLDHGVAREDLAGNRRPFVGGFVRRYFSATFRAKGLAKDDFALIDIPVLDPRPYAEGKQAICLNS